MQTIDRMIVGYLLNSVWQVTVIAALGLLCSTLLRRAPGRYRHILWVLCLAVSVLVPAATVVMQVRGGGQADESAPVFAETSTHVAVSHQGGWSFLSFRSRTRPVQFAPLLLNAAAWAYLIFLGLRCLQLARMYRRTSLVRRSAYARSVPPAIAQAAETCRQLFSTPQIPVLCSEEITSPSTVGWRKPVLLVPVSFFTDDIREEDAISALSHEMAHIRRRDFALNLLYESASVALCFHPATALIKTRIAQTRELACDEMAVHLLPSGKQYAHSLLNIARTMFAAAPSAKSNYAMGLFDTRVLEERIMNILRMPKISGRESRTRMLMAFVLVSAVSLLTSAFSLRVGSETTSAETQRFVGTWVTKYKGQTFITLKLKSMKDGLGGSCIHVDRLDLLADGELIPSSDQFVEQEIVQAKASGNKLDLRIGGHDSIHFELTLKGVNEADVLAVGDAPDKNSPDQAPPQKIPWHFERVAESQ
ncbi:MAG TPA: M56 family metallopeptidase [Candidatus Sulfotelmatobacter sp.]|nr:M56 family metallopeptidase [Candidatus Sulfotelmatobacter sp.]